MTHPTLTALIGPPGAGKTTLRPAYPDALVVSLDDTRRALTWCGCAMNQSATAHAVPIAQAVARTALLSGRDVLWDATNADRAARAALLLLAAETGARPVGVVLLPPEHVAQARNARRSDRRCACGWARRVPAHVITAMHAAITADLPGLPAEGWAHIHHQAGS